MPHHDGAWFFRGVKQKSFPGQRYELAKPMDEKTRKIFITAILIVFAVAVLIAIANGYNRGTL